MNTYSSDMHTLIGKFNEVNHQDKETIKSLATDMANILLDLPYEDPFNRIKFCDQVFNKLKYSHNNENNSYKDVIKTIIKTGLEVSYKINKDSEGTVIADPWTIKALEGGYEYVKPLLHEKEINEVLEQFKSVDIEDHNKVKELSKKLAEYVIDLPIETEENDQLYVWHQVNKIMKQKEVSDKENKNLILEVIAKAAVEVINQKSSLYNFSKLALINGISGIKNLEPYVPGKISKMREDINNNSQKNKPEI